MRGGAGEWEGLWVMNRGFGSVFGGLSRAEMGAGGRLDRDLQVRGVRGAVPDGRLGVGWN